MLEVFLEQNQHLDTKEDANVSFSCDISFDLGASSVHHFKKGDNPMYIKRTAVV